MGEQANMFPGTPLVSVVMTDLAAITRGRPLPAGRLDRVAEAGVGWVPANLCLTAFNSISDPNPWGSTGDLRILPDLAARYTTARTGSPTPFDMVMGDIVELDGTPWQGCPRTWLKNALAALEQATGLRVLAAFEQEFQLAGEGTAAHAFSFEALRRVDPFAPRLFACLEEAGIDPEMVLAEYGDRQFEITHAPADALTASSFADVVFFTNSGTEAVECALKTARKHHVANGQPERIDIYGFDGSFHGRTYGAINAAANPSYTEG